MISTQIFKVVRVTSKGDVRVARIKKNVIASFILKGVSVVASFYLLPLTLALVDTTKYGVWVTISSLVTWLNFFDLGLNNGLKNRVAESVTKSDYSEAKRYVSTAYSMLCVIFISIFILFSIANKVFDWTVIFNSPNISKVELSYTMLIVVGFICLRMILNTISVTLLAIQRTAVTSYIELLGTLATLICVYISKSLVWNYLPYLAIILCFPQILVLTVSSIYLYGSKLKSFAPSIFSIDLHLIKKLSGLGLKFFFIQIALLIQFQTTNLLISHFFGPSQVTPYNVAFKYFSLITVVFTILVNPLWAASSEAYAKRDLQWIISAVKRYRRVWMFVTGGGVLMLLFSSLFYKLWLPVGSVSVDWRISCWCFINVITIAYSSIYIQVLNGIGVLRIQLLASVISPFIFFLLSLFFVRVLQLQVYSILMATFFANIWGIFVAPHQYVNIFLRGKVGLWVK